MGNGRTTHRGLLLRIGEDGQGLTEQLLTSMPEEYPGRVVRNGCELVGADEDARWAVYRTMMAAARRIAGGDLCAWPARWGTDPRSSHQIARALSISVRSATWATFCMAMDQGGPVMLEVGDRVRLTGSRKENAMGVIVDVVGQSSDLAWYSICWDTGRRTRERADALRDV